SVWGRSRVGALITSPPSMPELAPCPDHSGPFHVPDMRSRVPDAHRSAGPHLPRPRHRGGPGYVPPGTEVRCRRAERPFGRRAGPAYGAGDGAVRPREVRHGNAPATP